MSVHYMDIRDYDLLKRITDWATEYGWVMSNCSANHTQLMLDDTARVMSSFQSTQPEPSISFDDLVRIVTKTNYICSIANHPVTITAHGIKVGCLHVKKDTIKTIYERSIINKVSNTWHWELYIPNPKLLKEFLKWALNKGWWLDKALDNPVWQNGVKYIQLNAATRSIGGSNLTMAWGPCTVAAAVELIDELSVFCMLGKYAVAKAVDGIMVNDVFVSNKQIKVIYDAVFNNGEPASV